MIDVPYGISLKFSLRYLLYGTGLKFWLGQPAGMNLVVPWLIGLVLPVTGRLQMKFLRMLQLSSFQSESKGIKDQ